MERTKIQLSEDELLLMQNSDWILTKNSIIEKISMGFGNLADQMQEQVTACPIITRESIMLSSPKISRGEKYRGLPYIILDFPRIFGKKDILAIRTLFWWGNYCSVTLHVKGIWREIVLQNITRHIDQLYKDTFYVSFSGDEWSHDLLDAGYTKMDQLSQGQILQRLQATPFLKIATKIEICPWIVMEAELFKKFKNLLILLRS